MPTIKNCLKELLREYTYKNMFHIMCSHENAMAAQYIENEEIKSLTYSDYKSLCFACAKNISEKIPNQKFIGIKLENSPLWPAVFWGIMMSGASPVLIDIKSDATATEHVLKQAGAKALITDEVMEIKGLTKLNQKDVITIDQRCEDFTPNWADACCLCTSGTTATSKVYLYDGNAMANQIYMAKEIIAKNPDILDDADDIKNLAFLPLHHIFGFIGVYMWYSFFGKTIVYIPDRTPDTILNTCRTLKVTHIFAVPLFWNNVAQGIIRKAKMSGREEKLRSFVDKSIFLQKRMGKAGKAIASNLFFKEVQGNLVGSSIRYMVSGGGHILPETLKIINGIGYRLSNGFGMTETGINSLESRNDIEKILSGSIGLPLMSTDFFIDQSGEVPELKIKGPALHTGRMVDGIFIEWDKNIHFPSGDIASFKNDCYYIEGRAKEVIINASGENVYPDELEDSFATLPDVVNLCVTGIKNEGVYEDTCLIIDMGDNYANKALVSGVINAVCDINTTLPAYKKINRLIFAREALPLANGIKVKRQTLKRQIEAGTLACDEADMKNRKLQTTYTQEAEESAEYGSGFDEIKENVRKIFGEVLTLDPASIKDTDHFIDDLGGDSLSSLGVFTRAEEMYNLIIPDTEYFSAVNVLEFSKLLYNKLNGLTEAVEQASAIKKITKFSDSREWKEFYERKQALETAGTKDPYFIPHDSALKATSIIEGKEIINLGSYNYLGFSGSEATNQAAIEALLKYGASCSGSRLLAGEKPLHAELECALAKWKHTEDAVVLVGGHSTNVTFVGNFCNKKDLILYDALSHNSIVQGCELSKSDTKAFPHNDLGTLEYMLKTARDKYEKILIIVEGVYSMDGDIAPIPDFVRLKNKYGAFLMVDEAHSTCVIGKNGGGVDDYFDLNPEDIDIKMGTLSKGLGTCGGYLCGSKELITYLRYGLPGFVFSVGLSPALAAATLSAVNTMLNGNPEVAKLHENIQTFMSEAKRRGFDTCLAGETAIIPIMIGSDANAFFVSEKLLDRGVFVPPAVFPAVPHNQARLRFSLTSLHTKDQLLYALEVLDQIFQEMELKK